MIEPEATSAIVRRLGKDRRVAGAILATLSEHLKGFDLMALDTGVLNLSVTLTRRHALRASDALHLASAILLARELGRPALRFATADREQALAARKERLRVIELPAG